VRDADSIEELVMAVEPTPRRRRLGAELRRGREAQGWTLDEAARHLGYRSPATVSKIEKGVQGVTVQQLPHFFQVYGINDPALRGQLQDLVRRQAEPDWWQRFDGVVDEPLSDYLSQVETATSLFVFNPVVLHGLLQTPDYTRAVTEASRVWKAPEDIDRFVAMRLEHQKAMLTREPPLKIWAVLTEGLLRQEVGGRAVHTAQIRHLATLAHTNPHITLQILPLRTGAHAGMDGPFMILTFAAGRDLVCLESMRASLHLNQHDTVELYRTTSDLLKSDALPRKDTIPILTALAEELST
jgi:transcriptional regulator with XRE-family HTH domain